MAVANSMVAIKKTETRMAHVGDSGAAEAEAEAQPKEERRDHAIRTLSMMATSTSRHCAALRELRSF